MAHVLFRDLKSIKEILTLGGAEIVGRAKSLMETVGSWISGKS